MESSIFAYTDESGNTGLDIFNREQPLFYTFTLFSKTDLDRAAQDPVARWCEKLGVPELHGNQLGVGRLALIAADILEFLTAECPLFFFTIVEKRHMAAMKFADTVLDAGLNMAMSLFHYNARPFRLALALDLARHMTPRLERHFWEAYARKNLAAFREIALKVESSVAMRMSDARGRELLGDALRWAAANPGELLSKRSKLDSPNLVAFSFVIQFLHELSKDHGVRVTTFVHDEQNEFMQALKMMYEMMTRVRFGEELFLPTFEEADTFECPLTVARSSSSPALQLVDVLLWLMKRYHANGTTGSEACDELLMPVLLVGMMNEFSLHQLQESTRELWEKVARVPLTLEQVRKGERVRDMLEAARRARALAPAGGG